MRYCRMVLAVFLLAAVSEAGQNPVPFEQNSLWGYRDKAGKIVIPPRFIFARAFSSEGIAAVVDDQGWAYINEKGWVVVRPLVFDNGPDYFSDGLARYVFKGRFGFFDKWGRIVIPARFDFAQPFSDGRAPVCFGCREVREGEHRMMMGGKWGFVDLRGDLVIRAEYDEVRSFRKGKADVRTGDQWRTINKAGKPARRP
jgi:hypothetical protein